LDDWGSVFIGIAFAAPAKAKTSAIAKNDFIDSSLEQIAPWKENADPNLNGR
jgi:hypothetical protein